MLDVKSQSFMDDFDTWRLLDDPDTYDQFHEIFSGYFTYDTYPSSHGIFFAARPNHERLLAPP